MASRRVLAIIAVGLAMAVSGCQTSSLDTAGAFAIAGTDPVARDIATGKEHFRQANYGLAEQHFRKAVEVRAASAEAWMGLAASYDQLGRFDFADRAYDQVLRLAGRRPEVVNNMGYSQYLRGDHQKARQLLTEARAGLPDPAVADANLALLDR